MGVFEAIEATLAFASDYLVMPSTPGPSTRAPAGRRVRSVVSERSGVRWFVW